MSTLVVNGSQTYETGIFSEGEVDLYFSLVTDDPVEKIESVFSEIKSLTIDNKDYSEYTSLSYITKFNYELGEPSIFVSITRIYDDEKALKVLTDSAQRVTYKEAVAKRAELELLADIIPDEEVQDYVWMFAEWDSEASYTAGTKVKYNDVVYKCLMDHDAQSNWNPEDAPSLWAKVLNPDPEVIPVWEQPGSTNPYMKGDKVHYPTAEDPIYMSTIDNNIWSPETYPQGWELIE